MAPPRLRAKERVVYAGLLLFTLWPAVHIGLVWRFDLSPWKAAGWGMYSAPRFAELGMEVYGRGDGQTDFDKLSAPSAPVRELATSFLERRRWLGRLARSDRLAAAVFAAHPHWREVRVIVLRPELDRSSGMVVWASSRDDHARQESPAQAE